MICCSIPTFELLRSGERLNEVSPSAEPVGSLQSAPPAIEDQRFADLSMHTRGICSYTDRSRQAEAANRWQLDSMIAERYQDPFRWYKTAMQRAHFSNCSHRASDLWSNANPETARRKGLYAHLMRIDPFLT